MKYCITGANSSVGRNLLQHLGRMDGHAAVALVRSATAFPALPQAANITPVAATYADHAALLSAFAGAENVVHLAGVLFEGKHSTYQAANVDSTISVLRAAAEARVPHVVYISVLGADAKSRNPFYRTKGIAEQLVTGSGLAATVLRTPLLLGPESAGGKALLREAQGGRAKLLGGGQQQVRPLDVDDLSAAIIAACRLPHGLRVLELCGPEPVAYRTLVAKLAALHGRNVEVATVPVWLARMLSGVSHAVKGSGMSPAIIDVITASEVVRENADAALGITLTPLEQTLRKL